MATSCRFFADGRCKKAATCRLHYDPDAATVYPLCSFFARGACHKGSRCLFSHDNAAGAVPVDGAAPGLGGDAAPSAGPAADGAPAAPAADAADGPMLCVACLSARLSHAIVVCGHAVLCGGCIAGLSACPMCRAPFTPKDVLRLFFP